MMTLAMIAGLWATTCIQTQISNANQGYVIEKYRIEATGDYSFEREWYSDPQCDDHISTDSESGTMTLGKPLHSFFSNGEVVAADFSSQNGVDLGALSLKKDTSIKVARGVRNSNMRNTMLSLFEYQKQ